MATHPSRLTLAMVMPRARLITLALTTDGMLLAALVVIWVRRPAERAG